VSKKFTLSTFVPLPHLTTPLKNAYIRRTITSGGTAYRRYNNGTTNEGHFRSDKFSCGNRQLESGTPAKASPAGHLRSDAVSLEVPVKVHGSRVTEVVREITPHTEPFEEQTSTMIVFPQGAGDSNVHVRQRGSNAGRDQLEIASNAICRVVKVRTFSKFAGYVEVEFTHKQPGYWSVYFPSEGPATANKPAQPAAPAPAVPIVKQAPAASASDISWAPAPAPAVTEKTGRSNVVFASHQPAVADPQIDSPTKRNRLSFRLVCSNKCSCSVHDHARAASAHDTEF